jgi:uncharacterized membrane protein
VTEPTPVGEPAAGEPGTDHTAVTAGDLPPADTVEAYEQVLPGAADRILTMLEHQSQHRIDMERTLVDSAARTERLGQLMGLGFVLLVFLVGTWLIVRDHEVAGTLLAVADLGLLAAVFLARDRGSADPYP